MGQTVADRVKAKRLDMGLKQPDFAHLVGIPDRTYQDYETGKRPIPSDRLVQIARRLKCDLNTFDPDYKPPEPASEDSKPMPPIEWVDKIAESVVSRLAAKSAPAPSASIDGVVAQIEALFDGGKLSLRKRALILALLKSDPSYLEGLDESQSQLARALLKAL